MNDKIKGALVGAVVGDALGYPFHNISPEEIEFEWGIVTDMESTNKGEAGVGGDYTQLMLLSMESIAECGKFDPNDIVVRLIEWLPVAKSRVNATYKSAEKLKKGVSWRESALDFPTSGPICRNLPYTILYLNEKFSKTEDVSITSSNITHKNLSSVAASNIYSFIIRGLLTDSLNPEDIDSFLSEVGEYAVMQDDEIGNTISNLGNLMDLDTMEGLRYISTTGDVSEVFPASIYCFLKSPKDFEKSLIAAVNAGFATDAHCFLVGGISGAYNGFSNIPDRWLEKTVNIDKVLTLIEQIIS